MKTLASSIVLAAFTITALVYSGCDDCETIHHDYTVTNNMSYDVAIFTGDGYDPANLTPPAEIGDYETKGSGCGSADPPWMPSHWQSGILGPGESETYINAFTKGFGVYFVEARRYVDQEVGEHVFIRKFTWDELNRTNWEVVIEPGYEELTWGPPVHHIVFSNELRTNVSIYVGGTDSPSGADLDGRSLPTLRSGEQVRKEYAVKEGYEFYFVQVEDFKDIIAPLDQRGDWLFFRRFTWEELEARDWIVVIEPGYEKPRNEIERAS